MRLEIQEAPWWRHIIHQGPRAPVAVFPSKACCSRFLSWEKQAQQTSAGRKIGFRRREKGAPLYARSAWPSLIGHEMVRPVRPFGLSKKKFQHRAWRSVCAKVFSRLRMIGLTEARTEKHAASGSDHTMSLPRCQGRRPRRLCCQTLVIASDSCSFSCKLM